MATVTLLGGGGSLIKIGLGNDTISIGNGSDTGAGSLNVGLGLNPVSITANVQGLLGASVIGASGTGLPSPFTSKASSGFLTTHAASAPSAAALPHKPTSSFLTLADGSHVEIKNFVSTLGKH